MLRQEQVPGTSTLIQLRTVLVLYYCTSRQNPLQQPNAVICSTALANPSYDVAKLRDIGIAILYIYSNLLLKSIKRSFKQGDNRKIKDSKVFSTQDILSAQRSTVKAATV